MRTYKEIVKNYILIYVTLYKYMKKIKNAVTKHRIFTSINVTHINS